MKVDGPRGVGAGSRVGRTGRLTPVSGAMPASPVGPSQPVRSVNEVAGFLGIPDTDLTPAVREGINRLLGEVERLRHEIEHRERRISYLERLADEDVLMPVLNRRAFVRELNRLISHVERYGGTAALLYLDVNGMKPINDRYGHPAGDAALHHVASLLMENLRGSDAVGRLGGDEFGILLVEVDEQGARGKAQHLSQTIDETPFTFEGSTLSVSASIGLVVFNGSESADDLLQAADAQMYEIKKGRPDSR